MRLSLLLSAVLLLALAIPAPPAQAQSADFQPRFGAGFDGTLVLGSRDVVRNGMALGARGRISFPVNADLSLAADAGFSGYLLGGRADASYAFMPQLSAILTFPALGQARYVIGGVGWHAPLGGADVQGGPTLHGGLGWILPLRETSLYVEVNPSFVIGETGSGLTIPLRIGVIL